MNIFFMFRLLLIISLVIVPHHVLAHSWASPDTALRQIMGGTEQESFANGGWGFSQENACVILAPPEHVVAQYAKYKNQYDQVRLEPYLVHAQKKLLERRTLLQFESKDKNAPLPQLTVTGTEITWDKNRLYEKVFFTITHKENSSSNSLKTSTPPEPTPPQTIVDNVFWFDITDIIRHDCNILWYSRPFESWRKGMPVPFSSESKFSDQDISNMQLSVYLAASPSLYYMMQEGPANRKELQKGGWGFSADSCFIATNPYEARSALIHRNNLLLAQAFFDGRRHLVAQKIFLTEVYSKDATGALTKIWEKVNTLPYQGATMNRVNNSLILKRTPTLQKVYLKNSLVVFVVGDNELDTINELKIKHAAELEKLKKNRNPSDSDEFGAYSKEYFERQWEQRESIIQQSTGYKTVFWAELPLREPITIIPAYDIIY